MRDYTSFLSGLLSFIFLSASSTWLLSLERRKRSQVDLLLRWCSNQKLVCINKILADFDVSLVNQDSCLMDWFSLEAFLINSGLQSFVQKFVKSKTQNVIELEFFIREETISMHSVEKCSSLEQSSWVFFLKSKQLSGSFSESGKQEMDSPYFSFIF